MNAYVNAPSMPEVSDHCSADEVVAGYCRMLGLARGDVLTANNQTRAVTKARYELCWLLRHLTVLSQREIGELFGRHQTSILEGVRVTADRIATDAVYRQHMQQLVAYLKAHRDRNADPRLDAALVLARRTLMQAGAERTMATDIAVTMLAVSAVLRAPDLTDAEARIAAVTLIRNGGGIANG